jgi:ribonuclease-3
VTARKTADSQPSPSLDALEALIDYRFRDRKLLERALVHSSAATEGDLESNQTFEFLGDAVLDLAVSEFLLRRHPKRAEGELTRMRASIVSAKGLATAAARLDLGRWIRLGRGEARSGGGKKANILADTYEAVVAAVFLDSGYEAARKLLEATFAQEIAAADPTGDDWKTELQELTQARYHCTPSYSLVSTSGPDHAKHFEVAIRVAGETIGNGSGASRKSAEQMAAREAVAVLRDKPLPPEPAPEPEAAPPRKRRSRAKARPADDAAAAAADNAAAAADSGEKPLDQGAR